MNNLIILIIIVIGTFISVWLIRCQIFGFPDGGICFLEKLKKTPKSQRITYAQQKENRISEFIPRRWAWCEECLDDIRGETMWLVKASCKGETFYKAYCKKCYPTKELILNSRHC